MQRDQLGRLAPPHQFPMQLPGHPLRPPGPRIRDHMQYPWLGHGPTLPRGVPRWAPFAQLRPQRPFAPRSLTGRPADRGAAGDLRHPARSFHHAGACRPPGWQQRPSEQQPRLPRNAAAGRPPRRNGLGVRAWSGPPVPRPAPAARRARLTEAAANLLPPRRGRQWWEAEPASSPARSQLPCLGVRTETGARREARTDAPEATRASPQPVAAPTWATQTGKGGISGSKSASSSQSSTTPGLGSVRKGSTIGRRSSVGR